MKEPEDYDDEEEEVEMPPTKKTFELKTWRPDSAYPSGGDRRGSADLFRKFASKNAGGAFRYESFPSVVQILGRENLVVSLYFTNSCLCVLIVDTALNSTLYLRTLQYVAEFVRL